MTGAKEKFPLTSYCPLSQLGTRGQMLALQNRWRCRGTVGDGPMPKLASTIGSKGWAHFCLTYHLSLCAAVAKAGLAWSQVIGAARGYAVPQPHQQPLEVGDKGEARSCCIRVTPGLLQEAACTLRQNRYPSSSTKLPPTFERGLIFGVFLAEPRKSSEPHLVCLSVHKHGTKGGRSEGGRYQLPVHCTQLCPFWALSRLLKTNFKQSWLSL